MTLSKPDRGRQILSQFLALAETAGRPVPSRGGGGAVVARRVDLDAKCHAIFNPGQRITIARHTPTLVGNRYVPDADWCLVEVYTQGRLSMIANVRGLAIGDFAGSQIEEIHLHLYIPGLWEAWFGVSNGGDTVALRRDVFADPKSPAWRALVESEDFKLPPLRPGQIELTTTPRPRRVRGTRPLYC